ncbi:MAG: dTDP-4-dehydrorhamnose 3,5-epimerase [Desulfobacterales bacterium]|nr:dTDP-4-dehydrorhamnose 3,5-epimerase [Desulfobacterales bacterium]
MKIVETKIPDLKVIEPEVFGDDRGFFMETYQKKKLLSAGISDDFVQDNHSKSTQGILRGLHFQKKNTQGKFVRVISGEVFDAAVDLRKDSPTYGMWEGVILSAENKKMFWVPEGFAHGFYVTSESAEFIYKCTNYYDPEYECSIAWNDPTIGIEWPLTNSQLPSLSQKDNKGVTLEEAGYFIQGEWESGEMVKRSA